jgi:hypothetical protein
MLQSTHPNPHITSHGCDYDLVSCGLTNILFIELRIHEHTERGDNESVKTAGKKGKIDSLSGVKCCSL